MATYQLLYYTDDGRLLDVFPLAETSEISCVITQNEVSTLTVTLPRGNLNWSSFAPDRILLLQRNYGAGYYTEADQGFFLRDWTFQRSNRLDTVTLEAYSGNYLLDGRIVAYNAGSAEASKTDAADDLTKAIVRENLGSSATDPARQLAGLTVDVDLGLGPSVSKAFSRRNVLRTIQQICDQAAEAGTRLLFDTVATTPGAFQFKTWTGTRGVDRSEGSGQPLVIEPTDASVTEAHSNERNYVYCGGGGKEEERVVLTATNSAWTGKSRWNRREDWTDARNGGTNTAYIQAEADAALYENRPRLRLEGVLTGAEGYLYGLHYRFGDLVTCKYAGLSFDCHITNLQLRYSGGNEDLRATVRGEL